MGATWGRFEETKSFPGARIGAKDITEVVVLPAERGAYASGAKAVTDAGIFHAKIYSAFVSREKDTVLKLRDEEAEILAALDGANGFAPRVQMTGTYVDASSREHPCIIMERAEGVDLYQAMASGLVSGNIRELPSGRQTALLGALLAKGVGHCHEKGITHRDLWPANIILEADRSGIKGAKFIDFGSSTPAARATVTAIGAHLRLAKQNFGAPEVFGTDSRQREKRNAFSVDVWSLGALLFYIRTGIEPMGEDPDTLEPVDPATILVMDSNNLRYLSRIKSKPLDLLASLEASNERITPIDKDLAWIIERCTDSRPMGRPSIDSVAEELARLAQAEKEYPQPEIAAGATPFVAPFEYFEDDLAEPAEDDAPEGDPRPAENLAEKPSREVQKRQPATRKRIGVALGAGAVVLALAGGVAATHAMPLASASGVEDSYAFTGKPVRPEPSITLFGRALTQDVDYTLAYENADGAGHAQVLATGANGMFGTLKIGYEVSACDLSRFATVACAKTVNYSGKPAEPEVTVEANGVKLTEGTDYTLSYRDNDKPGEAYAVVSGMGAYSGEVTVVFAITQKVGYTVRFVDAAGNSLAKAEEKSGAVGKKVEESAPEISGYTPTSPKESIVLKEDASKNIITFVYSSNVAPDPVYYEAGAGGGADDSLPAADGDLSDL